MWAQAVCRRARLLIGTSLHRSLFDRFTRAFPAAAVVGALSLSFLSPSSPVGAAVPAQVEAPRGGAIEAAAVDSRGAGVNADLGRRIAEAVASDESAALALVAAPMVGFVIDKTASMSQSLPGIRAGINALMDLVPAFQGATPPEFLFMTLGDPVISDPLITSSTSQVRSWVLGIQTGGGGDCPEPAMAALLRAVGAAPPNAAIFLFTDADAKDCDKSLLVAALARKKNISVYTVLTGACSSGSLANPSLQGPPDRSGTDRFLPSGSVELGPSEAQVISASACQNAFSDAAFLSGGMKIDATDLDVTAAPDPGKSYLDATVSPLAAIEGTLGAGVNSRTFPIDTTVQRVDFIVRMNSKQSIVIRQPNGTALNLAGVGVRSVSFDTGQSTSVSAPAAGNWTVEMTGSGAFNIVVLVKSPIALTEFRFVTLGGTISNRSYNPINQSPRSVGSVSAVLGFAGVTSPTTTQLVDAAGAFVTNVTVATGSNLASTQRLASMSNIAAPNRARISGTDNNGFAYQRVSRAFTRPTDLVLTALNVPSQMNANGVYFFNVSVQNAGSTRTFDFVADAGLRMDNVSVTPRSATIAGGGILTLTVRVDVPLDNPVTVVADFVVSARQSNGEGNALVVPILVIENLPPDCSGSYVYGIDTSHPSYNLEELLFGGIFDPEGQPVSVQITHALQDEPVEENTGGNANQTCPDAQYFSGLNLLRNESSANGNGRVYTGEYTASDPQGKQCTGTFTFCVPRRHGRGTTCTDDGQLYESLPECPRFDFGAQLSPTVEAPGLVVLPSSPARMDLKITGVARGPVRIRVFDISGRMVQSLWDGATSDGDLDLSWDTSDLGFGIYFVRAETLGQTLVRKVLLAR